MNGASVRKIDPRKEASQERSRAKLEAVFDAMDRVLARDGVEGFKVAEVAREAGVAKASIYDYYPTREALVDAWEERLIGRELARVGATVLDLLTHPPPFEVSILTLVRMVMRTFAKQARDFHYRQRLDLTARTSVRSDVSERVVAMMSGALAGAPDRHRLRGDLEVGARLAVHSVLTLSHVCALADDAVRETHATELARMIARHLLVDCCDAHFENSDESQVDRRNT